MNATQQAQAAALLAHALQHAGLRVERVVNDATRIGRTKHELQPVAAVVLIGVWLARGFVVSLPEGA